VYPGFKKYDSIVFYNNDILNMVKVAGELAEDSFGCKAALWRLCYMWVYTRVSSEEVV